jgi:hypothetical protein
VEINLRNRKQNSQHFFGIKVYDPAFPLAGTEPGRAADRTAAPRFLPSAQIWI